MDTSMVITYGTSLYMLHNHSHSLADLTLCLLAAQSLTEFSRSHSLLACCTITHRVVCIHIYIYAYVFFKYDAYMYVHIDHLLLVS